MNNGILKQICLCDVINQLPDVQPIQFNETFLHQEHELYICALGFEDRCLSMGRKLSSYNDFKCTSAIILEYDTNIEDNEMMKPELFKYIDTFSDTIISLQCNKLRNIIHRHPSYLILVYAHRGY